LLLFRIINATVLTGLKQINLVPVSHSLMDLTAELGTLHFIAFQVVS